MRMNNKLKIGHEITVPNKNMKIYPLFYEGVHTRQYKIIDEVKGLVTIQDSGRVNTVYIKNNSKSAVFIRAGSILEGNTQNRTLKRSVVVFPRTKTKGYKNTSYVKNAEVFCVHYSSPVNSSGTLGVDCLIPHNLEAMCYSDASQSQVWNNISTYNNGYYTSPYTDNEVVIGTTDNLLAKTKTITVKYKDVIDKIISENPELQDAVGVAIVDTAGVLALEIYDCATSWVVMMRKILEKYSIEFNTKPNAYSTGKYWKTIKNEILSLLSGDIDVLNKFSDNTKVQDEKWVTVTYQGNLRKKYEVELTKLNNKIIHVAAVRGSKYYDSGLLLDTGPIGISY